MEEAFKDVPVKRAGPLGQVEDASDCYDEAPSSVTSSSKTGFVAIQRNRTAQDAPSVVRDLAELMAVVAMQQLHFNAKSSMDGHETQ